MKKISLLILLLSAFNFGFGQTILSPGDIVITGFNSDNPDQFSFVLLADLSNTTTINFTDNGWRSSGVFRSGEGTITWTANSDLPCGTEIIITDNSPFSASIGSVTDSGILQLSSSGDQILAYQGLDTSPIFIYAVHFDGAGWSSDATNPNTSAIPTGLTNGANAIAINDTDNASYNCSVTSENALILAAVSNSTNWTSSGSILTLGGCAYTCSQCLGITTTWDGVTSTWDNGIPTSTDNVILDGDFTTVSGVNLLGCTLTVNAGYTLTVTNNTFVEIQNEVIVDGTIDVNPYGSFVQRNDALGATGTTVNAGGNILVRKETSPMRAWYEYTYWSSPVQNETIDALIETEPSRRFIFQGQNFLDHCAETANNNILVCDDGFGNGVQDGVDDDRNDWAWVSGGTIMQPGVGYAATLTDFAYSVVPGGPLKQITLSPFVGPFNNGIIDVPVYRNDSELNDDNLNLIGNPYPSAIDVDLFLAENRYDAITNPTGALDGIIYLWSQNTAPSAIVNGNQQLNFSDSDYAIINGASYMAGGDGIAPTNRIPSGQAFFVTCSNNAPATLVSGDVYTADATFNNSMRTIGATDNSLFFKDSNSKKQTNSIDNKLWVNLTSDNGVFNQMAVAYVNGATDNNDGSFYDASKPSSIVTGAILYSNIEGSDKKFGIQGKASNSLDINETISLGFKSNIGVATLFKLSIDHLQGDFLDNNTIYLKDNLLNKVHNLSASDYTFTTEVGEFNDRFEIVFNADAALSINETELNTNKFSIVDLNNNTIQFNTNSNLSIKTIQVFDLLGRQLYDLKGSTNSETYTLPNLNTTIYIAKIELSNGVIITKKAIKK